RENPEAIPPQTGPMNTSWQQDPEETMELQLEMESLERRYYAAQKICDQIGGLSKIYPGLKTDEKGKQIKQAAEESCKDAKQLKSQLQEAKKALNAARHHQDLQP